MAEPTDKHWEALRKIRRNEQGETVFVNPADAEECENYGWAEAQPLGGWRLTEEGNRMLDSHR